MLACSIVVLIRYERDGCYHKDGRYERDECYKDGLVLVFTLTFYSLGHISSNMSKDVFLCSTRHGTIYRIKKKQCRHTGKQPSIIQRLGLTINNRSNYGEVMTDKNSSIFKTLLDMMK